MNERKKILHAKKLLNEALESIDELIKNAKTEREKQHYEDIKNRISGSLERERNDEEKYPDKTLFADAKKILRKFSHLTEKRNKDEKVSDEFVGLMDGVDFETKMANLNPQIYEEIFNKLDKECYQYESDEKYEEEDICLIKILKESEDDDLRMYATKALGNIGHSIAVPALIEALKDKYVYVCNHAVMALGKIGDPKAVPALIELFENDIAKHIQGSVAEALGKIGDPKAVPALIDALKDKGKDIEVRKFSAEALG
ncbi:MAG: HEAT repeat domain-containing protein, partial [Candidatus Aenigmarchaeota archaeon]|nr:HEAT repeat domain-containing protein [Candidatus Aenigmarchaeota archaeon]